MNNISRARLSTALPTKAAPMTTAQDIASDLGREWIDCGAYERMAFEDEARRLNSVRRKLAQIIHDAWSVEPFDDARHTEDLAAADAVIAAFPQINT